LPEFSFIPEKVEAWAKQQLDKNPSDGQVLGYLYMAYKLQDKDVEAKEIFRRIESLEKDASYDAFVAVSGLLSGFGSQEEAETMVKRAIGINKKRTDAWSLLGGVYKAMGRRKESVAALKEATKLGCNSYFVWLWLGCFYNEQKEYTDAIQALQKAHEINPQDFDSLQNLAIAYSALNQQRLARSAYDKMLALRPNDELTMLLIAQHEFLEGRKDSSIDWYRNVIEYHPSSTAGWRGLATTLELVGKKSEAKEVKLKANEHGITVFLTSGEYTID
jgi:tetratricopeptide (TPR) repeat protein